MSHARIGKITMKAGGAEVRVLRQETPNQNGGENWAGMMISGAKRAAEFTETSNGITGYLIVAFYGDGTTFTSHRWGDESPMNRAVLPHFVAEVVRRDVITDPDARNVFDEMYERI